MMRGMSEVMSRRDADGIHVVTARRFDLDIARIALRERVGGGLDDDAALLGDVARVDDVDGDLAVERHAAGERCHSQNRRVRVRYLATCRDLQLLDAAANDLRQNLAAALGNGDEVLELRHDVGRDARGVHRCGNRLALEAGDDVLGDLRGRANLGLLGGCAQVRGDDGVLELVDGRVGDRLVLPHVDAGAGKVSVLERIGKRIEVDQAAARDVEDDGAFGHLGQLLGADHASGLGGLGHVQGDEVGLLAHLVDVIEQRDAVMGGTLGRAVRVIADELHAKGGGTLGNKQADVTGAEDAERLVLELLARELGAIPLAFLHGRARCRGVTCGGEHERHGLLGSGHDVGERRVAHDDAALGGSLAVDVVDAHAGAADDLELVPASMTSRVTVVAERTMSASYSGIISTSSSGVVSGLNVTS